MMKKGNGTPLILCSNRSLIDGYQLILNNRAWCPVGETNPLIGVLFRSCRKEKNLVAGIKLD